MDNQHHHDGLETDPDGSNTSPAVKSNDPESEPLLQTQDGEDGRSNTDLPKQLSVRHAFAVLVSSQIGSGIFASPAQIDINVPSPGAALLIWLAGGLLSWVGASSFSELGAAIPMNGGMQEYLRYVYGDIMAFLMSWIYIVATKPSAMAIQTIVLVDTIISVVGPSGSLATWKSNLIYISAFLFILIVNSINTKTTLRLSESFTAFKIGTVLLIALGGLVAVSAHVISPGSPLSGSEDWYNRNWFQSRGETDWPHLSTWQILGHFSAALYAALWAYDGWDNANVVASEIRDPGRSLPLAIKASMTVALTCYELVNISFYILLAWDTLGQDTAVAVTAAKSLLGYPGGVVMAFLIAISCAGAITSNIFVVGRLTVAASQRHYLPAFLDHRGLPKLSSSRVQRYSPITSDNVNRGVAVDPDCDPSAAEEDREGAIKAKFDAPLYANVLTALITVGYILIGNISALLSFVGMAGWFFYVSTGIGLLILRRREPDLHRPYKPPFFVPITFVVIGTLVIIRSAIFAPIQSITLVAFFFAGILVGRLRSRY